MENKRKRNYCVSLVEFEYEMILIYNHFKHLIPKDEELLSLTFDYDDSLIIMCIYKDGSIFSYSSIEEALEDDSHVYIKDLYLPAKIRRKGLGTQIVNSFINHCRNYGIKFIEVEPTENSDVFWSNFGFVQIEEEKEIIRKRLTL